MPRFARLVCLIIVSMCVLYTRVLAQSDPVFDLLGRIDALRRQNGLAPLALNDQLAAAAQRHSQDMANTGSVDHTGSDGSTPEQRIAASGYGPSIIAWGENIYGGGIATADDAWGFWTTSAVHRNNLLSERYREIGIGVAGSANGTFFTLNFGARTGVLPFFVDQGSLLSDPHVTLTLSNEDAAPGGSMGRAVEVRVGEGEDLSVIAWQPWQRSIPFTLSNVAGQHHITVEYRDARGTIASYFRIVSLSGAAQPTDQPSNQPTIQPTNQPSIQPTTQSTNQPTTQPTATSTPLPSPTSTPSPSATPTATPSPTATNQPTIHPTTQPPTQPSISLTRQPAPTSPPAAPLEAFLAQGWSDAPADWLGLAIGLQVAVIAVGAVILIRRSTRS